MDAPSSPVSPISPLSSADQPSPDARFREGIQNFRALESDLKSGDLAQAQTDLGAFVKRVQASPGGQKAASLLNPNTQTGQGLKSLQIALQSGDVSAAQRALAALRQDFHHAMQSQGAGRAHLQRAQPAAAADTPALSETVSGSSREPGSSLDVQA
jgi:hypothetical protein